MPHPNYKVNNYCVICEVITDKSIIRCPICNQVMRYKNYRYIRKKRYELRNKQKV
jgi:hypothetical protein